MQQQIRKLSVLLLAIGFVMPAMADKTIDLMKDPTDGKPQIISKKQANRKFKWESRDYSGVAGTPAPAFRLVFNNLTKAQLEALVDSTTPPITDSGGKAELVGVPDNPGNPTVYTVKINFKANANKSDGYRYTVWMGNVEMDPRVRPR